MFNEQKPDDERLAPELVALERQLRGLTPALLRIDRDRLMFEAGRAAGSRSESLTDVSRPRWPGYIAGPFWAGRVWPAATAVMTAASILLATMLVRQERTSTVVEQAPAPAISSHVAGSGSDEIPAARFAERINRSMERPGSDSYLGVRYVALTDGVGALPSDDSASTDDGDRAVGNSHFKPATARDLMKELLRVGETSNPSRS